MGTGMLTLTLKSSDGFAEAHVIDAGREMSEEEVSNVHNVSVLLLRAHL